MNGNTENHGTINNPFINDIIGKEGSDLLFHMQEMDWLFEAALSSLQKENDPETKLSHLAHAGCCVMFLLTYTLLKKTKFDDRVKL